MGAACAADESADTAYLQRLILIYQLISKDEALKAALAEHFPFSPQAQQHLEGPPAGWGPPCRSCDARLQAEAVADVLALRKHVLSSSSAFASCRLSDSQPLSSAASSDACSNEGGESVQASQRQRRGPYDACTSASSSPPTTTCEGDQQQSDDCVSGGAPSEEASEGGPSGAPTVGRPLVLAYDPRTGLAVPRSPSGIASHGAGAPTSPLGSLGGPPCVRGGGAKAGRVFVDGVFDLLHSGHFNALRQARQLGRSLVVGVNSDVETFAAKGCWPIYTQEERAEIVASCKWVDEVVVGTPYEVTTDLLDALACEAAAHGDDWVVGADGRDAYAQPRAAGRMMVFKRTEGISSTCITRRLLEATAHLREERVAIDRPQSVGHFARQALQGSVGAQLEEGAPRPPGAEAAEGGPHAGGEGEQPGAPCSRQEAGSGEQQAGAADEGAGEAAKCRIRQRDWSVFMSSKRLLQFIGEAKKPKPNDRVVYVDGSFDVLHVGHVRILKIAKEMGDYLIVGIHDDATVSAVKGPGFPVMNVNERALNVLAMRMVDEVIIGAPWKIPEYLLHTFGIHVVVRGTRIDSIADPLGDVLRQGGSAAPAAGVGGPPAAGAAGAAAAGAAAADCRAAEVQAEGKREEEEDPYRVPKELGIYREVESFSSWTTKELVTRLIRNRQALSESLQQRERKETRFWDSLRGQAARLTAELKHEHHKPRVL